MFILNQLHKFENVNFESLTGARMCASVISFLTSVFKKKVTEKTITNIKIKVLAMGLKNSIPLYFGPSYIIYISWARLCLKRVSFFNVM